LQMHVDFLKPFEAGLFGRLPARLNRLPARYAR
jgi:hypothetical protein